jgi:hypothetical protein
VALKVVLAAIQFVEGAAGIVAVICGGNTKVKTALELVTEPKDVVSTTS